MVSQISFPELNADLELATQKNGEIISSKGEKTPIKNYKRDITEEIRNYSTAKFGRYKGKTILVGALARLYFAAENTEGRKLLNFQNPFHNNLAQAIEILLYHQKAEQIINQLLKSDFNNIQPFSAKITKGKGIGAVEAPRGGLYHEIHFDEKGIITYANIITPTVQNLTSIEKSANALLEQNKNRPQKELERLLNMLVRAYDPCITCSVH